VIGGDPEGLALAQAYRRLGSEVTIVPQGWALSDFDIETASILAQGLVNEGIRMLDGGRVRRIQPRSQGIGAIVDLADGSETALDLSHILVCDGAVPDLGELGIEGAKLRAVRGQGGRFAMGAAGQTSNRRVRVVGAAAAMEPWHLALAHGRSVIEDLVL